MQHDLRLYKKETFLENYRVRTVTGDLEGLISFCFMIHDRIKLRLARKKANFSSQLRINLQPRLRGHRLTSLA